MDKLKAQVLANDEYRTESMKLKNFSIELQGNISDLRMDLSAKNQEIQMLKENCEVLQV